MHTNIIIPYIKNKILNYCITQIVQFIKTAYKTKQENKVQQKQSAELEIKTTSIKKDNFNKLQL